MLGYPACIIRRTPRPVPLTPPVAVADDEQAPWASMIRAHATPQAVAFRCQLILRAAAPAQPSNRQGAQERPVTALPWAVGAGALGRRAAGACKRCRARVGRGTLPPAARLDVRAMATRQPARDHCAATRWRLDDVVAALAQGRPWTMRRSHIGRMLDEVDLRPHRRV